MHVRQTRGGLLLAEESAAPASIREALKRIDPDLVLGQEVDFAWSEWVWKVLLRQGDKPAIWLFDWREDLDDPRSRPRPLSSAIVEEVVSRRLGSRRPVVDPLAANDRLKERLEREAEEQALETAAEVKARRRRRSPPHRSQALRMARSKARTRGENV